jgi:peroxiredoxin Q/BCP
MTDHLPLKPGDPAPDFALLSDEGETVRLSDLRGKRVVVYFYPKDDTAGCTAQACGFRDRYAEVEEKGAVILGLSPDGRESHQQFKAKFNLPFTLLVDTEHAVADRYGAWGEQTWQDRKYMGISRSHFVIDENGKILDARVRVSPQDSVEGALGVLLGGER